MKKMRKLLALILTLVMTLSLVNTAFAAGETVTLSITGGTGIEYTAYRMFDIETAANGGHKYKILSGWEDFITDVAHAKEYFTVQTVDASKKYAIWAKGTAVSPADGAALAALARNYIADPVHATAVAAHKVSGTLSSSSPLQVPKNGYYLLIPNNNTASGLLAVLEANIEVKEKVSSSGMPTVIKEVMEDSTGKYGAENDAEIGETIYFQITITAGAQARNYVLHDNMDTDHMQFTGITELTRGGNAVAEDPLKTYSVVSNPGDGCAFHVVFSEPFCAGLHDKAIIVVKYTAKLLPNAADPDNAVDTSHENETWLTHVDEHTETLHAKTTTKTYNIKVNKVDQNGTPLAGATFVLQDNVDKYYKWDDGNGVSWVTSEAEATKFTTPTFIIKGVDAEIFTLVETVVPEGYTGQTDIDISTKDATGTPAKHSQEVTVTNVLGTQLPTTGGMGTTMFYVGGGLLVAAAVVLLALKKRKAE